MNLLHRRLLRPALLLRAACLALGTALTAPGIAVAAPLVAALEAEVATLDPHFSTAYITRAFGYTVYDTLFGLTAKGEIKPQMVQDFTVSDDRLSWRFTLREGLLWHDGAPVTAADCVASIRRWQARASVGRALAAATASLEVVDVRTFELKLRQPFGLVLDALGRPNTPVPFMMPERLVRTAGDQRITEITGSGPFIFRAELYTPGDRIVLDRNPRYVPRDEPADFLAGGKHVNIEGLILRTMPDSGTTAAALQSGQLDYVQNPAYDLLGVLARHRNIIIDGPAGMNAYMGFFRPNHAIPPFNDPEIRKVLWRLFDQDTVLAALGLPDRLIQRGCLSWFMCGGTPYETTEGSDFARNPSIAAAKAALARTAYRGEPVVVMQAADIDTLRVSSSVAADLLRQAGFNVDLQAMDWGTLLQRRSRRDGWNLYGVSASGYDLASPLTHFYLSSNCIDATPWACDPRMTPLFSDFAAAQTEDERRRITSKISVLGFENTPAVMWGQFVSPAAWRNSLTNVIPSSIPLFWGVGKR